MDKGDEPPSPGPSDDTPAQLMDTPLTAQGSSIKTLEPFVPRKETKDPSRLQEGTPPGGKKLDERVLFCTELPFDTNYKLIFDNYKQYGDINRIKLVLNKNPLSFKGYITFVDHESAKNALEKEFGNDSTMAKLMNSRNIQDEIHDFIPKIPKLPDFEDRSMPIPAWYVASYKEGSESFTKAAECIEDTIGNIQSGNIKRYGKGILVKAGTETQAALLMNFNPPGRGNIKEITAHRTFNTSKGVVYNKEFSEFSEEEILVRCPKSVYKVQKLKGTNHVIVLYFTSEYIPDYIKFGKYSKCKVKPFRINPIQCYNCFQYGHVASRCTNSTKCGNCSGPHEEEECESEQYCCNCNERHSPKSRNCPRYKFEQEVSIVAQNEHVSFGAAKRIVMGANSDPTSSYSSIINSLKVNKKPRNEKPAIQNPKEKLKANPLQANEVPDATTIEPIPNAVIEDSSAPSKTSIESIETLSPSQPSEKNKNKPSLKNKDTANSKDNVKNKDLTNPSSKEQREQGKKTNKIQMETDSYITTLIKKPVRRDSTSDEELTTPIKKQKSEKKPKVNEENEIATSNRFQILEQEKTSSNQTSIPPSEEPEPQKNTNTPPPKPTENQGAKHKIQQKQNIMDKNRNSKTPIITKNNKVQQQNTKVERPSSQTSPSPIIGPRREKSSK